MTNFPDIITLLVAYACFATGAAGFAFGKLAGRR